MGGKKGEKSVYSHGRYVDGGDSPTKKSSHQQPENKENKAGSTRGTRFPIRDTPTLTKRSAGM